jgi:hydroxyacylglutathione hydrolase
MRIIPYPVFDDNYSYLVVDEATKTCAVVDPAEPEKALAAAEKEGLEISYILTTHHHWDHAGGNEALAKTLGDKLVVVGSAVDGERIPAMTKPVQHGEQFLIGNLNVTCHFTPCHTRNHILYHVTHQDQSALFTGDTLFVAGCGKFFEGNAEQMCHALLNVVPSLPHQTKVFPGHEYTVSNLKFAVSVQPESQAAKAKLKWAEEQRAQGIPTIPSTIAEELTYNPFMKAGQVRDPSIFF